MIAERKAPTSPALLAAPACGLIIIFSLLLLIRGQVWGGFGVDEVYYYAQIVSPVWDEDLDFSNEMLESRNDFPLRLRMADELYLEGRPNFPFSYGMAHLSLPVSWTAKVLDGFSLWQLGGGDPYAWVHRAAPSIVTWAVVLAGLLALLAVAARYTEPWKAFLLVLVIFLGTNVSYYTWHDPMMAHGASFGSLALLLWATIRFDEKPDARRALLLGCLCGLAFLLRWQNIAAGLLPMIALVSSVLQKRLPASRAAGYGALILAACLVVAFPQFLIWWRIFGSWFLIPQGNGFFQFDISRVFLVLFSPINGWIYTHPLIFLLMAGFVIGFRRGEQHGNRESRNGLVYAVLVVVVFQALVNSLPGDWWAGGSYGARRFTGVTALLILPGALLIDRLKGWKLTIFFFLSGLCVMLNLLVLLRWVQAPPPRLFWLHFFERIPETFRLIAGQSDTLFSSDLFSDPRAVDHPDVVRGGMLVILTSILAIGLIAFRLRDRINAYWRHLEYVGIAALLLLTVVSVFKLANAARTEGNNLSDWSRLTQGLEDEEIREFAAVQIKDSGIATSSDVHRLRYLLGEEQFDEANALSEDLEPLFPKTVLDCWLRYGEPNTPHRDRWTRGLAATLHDLPPGTLDSLFVEACRLRREDDIESYHHRIGGPRWMRESRRFEREYWKASAAPELRRHLHDALDANPFWLGGQLEMLRLRAAAGRSDDYYRRVERASDEALALARYVSEWMPEHRQAFEPEWRSQLLVRCRGLEELGHSDELEELIDLGSTWGLSDGFEEGLRFELEWVQDLEKHIATGDMLRFPGDDAVAGAEPDWLWPHDGWRLAEISNDGIHSWSWSTREVAFVRLNSPLKQGHYDLRANLSSLSDSDSASAMKVDIYGRGEQDIRFSATGDFHYRWRIHVTEEIDRPIVRLYHPLMPLNESEKETDDPTRVGLCLFDMWVVPVED